MFSKRSIPFILLLPLVIAAGWWLGGLSVPKSNLLQEASTTDDAAKAPDTNSFRGNHVWFYAGIHSEATTDVLIQELAWADKVGVRQIMLSVPPPITNTLSPQQKTVLAPLTDAHRLLLEIKLDAPGHGDSSSSDSFWKVDAPNTVRSIMSATREANTAPTIQGVILSPENGDAWLETKGPDATEDLAHRLDTLSLNLKRTFPSLEIYIPYRLATEEESGLAPPDMQILAQSAITGFVFPAQPTDRGLGQSGHPSAPIHAATQAQKKWIYLDRTHTGISVDESGSIVKPPALDTKGLLGIFTRNFGQAYLQGGAIAYTDVSGTGNLHHAEFWETFGALNDSPPMPSNSRGESEIALVLNPQADNRHLQHRALRSVYRTGLSAHITTLDALLDNHPPQAAVYVMPTPIGLSPEHITALHKTFAQREALVIWLSDPDHYPSEDSAEYLSALTGTSTQIHEGEFFQQARYPIKGHWTEKDQVFGHQATSSRRLIIDEEEVDVLLRYPEEDAICAAIQPQDAGWTSVHVTLPHITPTLVLELVELLEIPVSVSQIPTPHHPITVHRPPYLLIHAPETHEVHLEFDQPYSISDMLDPTAGWPNKSSLTLPMQAGQTRMLRMAPIFRSDEN